MRESIEALRAELVALDVDSRTIDELEDHFASTIEARLAAGDTLDEAVATARARLGDLAALSREDAKVASPFGARPGRAIAWSVAAAMLVWPALVASEHPGAIASSITLQDYFVGFGMVRTLAVIGLLFRQPPAAVMVQGIAACELAMLVANVPLDALDSRAALLFACSAGSCVLLARRWTLSRLAMFAIGFILPTTVFVIGSPLKLLIPLVSVLAATSLALRARFAVVTCGLLTVMVLVESIRSIAYVLSLRATLGSMPWMYVDLVASALTAVGAIVIAIAATQCHRSPRAILARFRVG